MKGKQNKTRRTLFTIIQPVISALDLGDSLLFLARAHHPWLSQRRTFLGIRLQYDWRLLISFHHEF
jgi:hypothetical protein